MEDAGQQAEGRFRLATGTVLKRLRTARGWSYREFSERVGVAHTSLYAAERFEATPSVDTLGRVAAAVDLTFPALLALILDELTADDGSVTLARVTEAAGALTDRQRAELLAYVDFLRYRDNAREQDRPRTGTQP
jgi:transcriptional regulator with XRE-family HTH domain